MNITGINVEIITIGDEILIGQIVDTNSAWMAVELNKAGFEIMQITSIHDDAEHIVDSLNLALKRADVVLITGGVGPTKDDITKQTLCKYFNTKLIFNQQVYNDIEQLLRYRTRAMNELTAQQAMVPENCTVIRNPVGTAPIMLFEKEGKIVVSMPGVPYEMKNAMLSEVLPRLQKFFKTPAVIHKTVQVHGIPESALALKIEDWENALPQDIHLAYLPNYGIVKLRLSGSSNNSLELEFSINQQIAGLTEILGNSIVSFDDNPVEFLIGNLLKSNGKMLATAESCTGGNIARRITSVAGSSEYFKGSVIAYSNEVKSNILHVKTEDLEKFGAVSKEVVEQMAIGVRKLLKADVSIATSGIAGPSGGTAEKPVGTTWISVCSAESVLTKEFKFNGLREQNIDRATQEAFLLLKELL